MLSFLRSEPSSVAGAHEDPDTSNGSLDLSYSRSEGEGGDEDHPGELSLHSEDGDLSAYSSQFRAASSSRTASSSTPASMPSSEPRTPISVISAVRSQHPNLSVFRPSTSSEALTSSGGATTAPTLSLSTQNALVPSPSVSHQKPRMVTSSPVSAGSDGPTYDSPTVKALQSRQVFMLKPKRRAALPEAAGQPPVDSESPSARSTQASGFLIQGLNPRSQHSSTSAADERAPLGHDGIVASPAAAAPRSSTPIHFSPFQSDTRTPDASVKGILRMPRTPGTGSSVRFGKRLYDDGDESAMSASIENSPEAGRHHVDSPSPAAVYETDEDRAAREEEEADVEWSLSFGTPQKRNQAAAGTSSKSPALSGMAALTGSPHSQLSLSSLNDSPDHDQIQAIRDLSTSTEEDEDDSGSFNDSAGSGSHRAGSRSPTSSPTVRIPMAKTGLLPSPLGRSSFNASQQIPDTSESRLGGLSTAFGDQTNEASNLLDLSIDNVPLIDDTHSLASIESVRAAARADRRSLTGDRTATRTPKSSIESIPSSASYDSSEASFSESFLREAGADMLAGLEFDYVESDRVPTTADTSSSHVVDADMAEARPLETPRPARFAEMPAAVNSDQSLHPLDELSFVEGQEDASHAVDTHDRSAGSGQTETGPQQNDDKASSLLSSPSGSPSAPQSSQAPDHDEQLFDQQDKDNIDERSSSIDTSPGKHSETPDSQPSARCSPPMNRLASPAQAAQAGLIPLPPSPQTPLALGATILPQEPTPGNLSVATTAADWATPQWAGPTPRSSSAAEQDESIEQSMTSSATSASPTREKLARKVGDLGMYRASTETQMVLRPGKLVPADHGTHGKSAQDSVTISAAADLEEIVAVIQQLDQAHTEHGSYLVSRAQQAETKFGLLSHALQQETLAKERALHENAVAREKVQALQDKIDGIMLDFESSKAQGRVRDAELEALVHKLNGQLERRQRDKAWQVRAEELDRQLEDERRRRASERQDLEVRLSAALREAETARPSSATAHGAPLGQSAATLGEDERQQLIQETREQTRDSCRRDYEVRADIAHREAQQEIDQLRAVIEDLRERAATTESSSNVGLENAEAVDSLQTELEALKSQHRDETSRLNDRIDDLVDQLHSSRREVEALDDEKAESEARATNLESRVDTAEARAEDCTAQLEECQEELSQLKQDLELTQSDLTRAEQALRQRDDELVTFRAEQEQGQSEAVLSLERKVAAVQEEAEQLQTELRAAESLVDAAKAEQAQVGAMLEQANEQRKDDLDAIAKLRLELDEAGRDKEDMLTSLTELEEFHAREQARVHELEAQVASLGRDKDHLATQLREAESLQADKVRGLAAELDAARAQIEVHTHQADTQAKLQAELERLRARIAALEHESADRGLTIVKLTKAKEKLEDENTNYGIALSAKQLELSMLKRNARIALGEATSTPRAAATTTNHGSSVKSSATTVSASRAVSAGMGQKARPVLGALSGNAVASTGLTRRNSQLKATEEEDEEPVEAMTLQKGPAALKGHRRRTLDPTTVISIGRLRPRSSVSTVSPPPPTSHNVATAQTPSVDTPMVAATAKTMPPPSSTKPLTRRLSTAAAAAPATATGSASTTRKVSAATQARIDRRQSMVDGGSRASSAASSRAPSPASSVASSRRSSVSNHSFGSGVEAVSTAAPSASTPVASRRTGGNGAGSSSSSSISARSARTLEPASTAMEVEDLPLLLSELQGRTPSSSFSTTATSREARRSSTIHRRLSALPPPPEGVLESEQGGSTTPRASRSSAVVSGTTAGGHLVAA